MDPTSPPLPSTRTPNLDTLPVEIKKMIWERTLGQFDVIHCTHLDPLGTKSRQAKKDAAAAKTTLMLINRKTSLEIPAATTKMTRLNYCGVNCARKSLTYVKNNLGPRLGVCGSTNVFVFPVAAIWKVTPAPCMLANAESYHQLYARTVAAYHRDFVGRRFEVAKVMKTVISRHTLPERMELALEVCAAKPRDKSEWPA